MEIIYMFSSHLALMWLIVVRTGLEPVWDEESTLTISYASLVISTDSNESGISSLDNLASAIPPPDYFEDEKSSVL